MNCTFRTQGASDIGLVRTNNEDVWLSSPEDALFIVADGLGGHQAGEVASREGVNCFFSTFRKVKKNSLMDTEQEISDSLKQCFDEANHHIFSMSFTHEKLRGMGTTLSALSFHNQHAAISYVGDSRIYRLRDGEVDQLSHDHCWTRRFFDLDVEGEGLEEISMPKGVLTRALGTTPAVEPTIRVVDLKPSDLFLLCSDGLSDMLSKKEIQHVLKLPLSLNEKVKMLVSVAKQKGGVDNITVILVEVETVHEENLS